MPLMMVKKKKRGTRKSSGSKAMRLFQKWVDVNWYSVSTTAGLNQGNSASVTSSFSTYSICGLAQGLDRVNRIGRVVRFTRFKLKGHIEAAQETLLFSGDYNNNVRIALVKPRDPTASLTGLTTVYLPVGDPITGLFNDDAIERVLYDKSFNVQTQLGPNSSGSGAASFTNYAADINIDLPLDLLTVYSGTAAASPIESGQLILIAVSDSNATPNPSMSASFRVYYEDVAA
jgi:hypothetical protein